MGNKELISKFIFDKINSKTKKNKVRKLTFIKYTAAASIAILFSIAIWNFNSVYSNVKLSSSKTAMDSIKLVDGSVIYLGANTTFEYPKTFSNTKRKVVLHNGNAFFKIAHNPQKPFIIHTNGMDVKVLGTSFNISLKQNTSEVTVKTGKVNVKTADDSIDLIPNQLATFSKINKTLTKNTIDQNISANWYKKDLDFEDISLKEVTKILEYRFGVHFVFKEPSTENKHIAIFIQQGKSLDSILQQINYITYLKFKRYEDNVIVSKGTE